MTLRLYCLAIIIAAALTGVALALIADGRPVAGLTLSTAALLLALGPLLWLLRKAQRP